MRTFKERLAADEIIRVFALGRMVQPLMVEMFGLAGGYHGVWFDQEHVTHTTPELATVALAARANEFDSCVRMAPTGYTAGTQALGRPDPGTGGGLFRPRIPGSGSWQADAGIFRQLPRISGSLPTACRES